ncbi:beta-CASP ribonuclease aCPSF1 [Candidatus Woesearchaeota archaeon]|nr:beta-CASP ribonuclease aCPSF1 [Candidatus Woesearchaeota archaeon]MBW3014446.1 beta-CASP ribonuclease aCPSF1 [Candidatus Woesearchaeota archaeon]
MPDIIKEILKIVPEDKISLACFEGANIVLYTKEKKFFLDNEGIIKQAVDEFKKRIELRPDPSIAMDQKKTEEFIKKTIPEEAGLANILFDPQRSHVVIEAEKPGLAIGKQGQLLRDIREKTFWVPLVRRTPAIKCELIDNIRGVLFENNDFRRKFLDKTGHRIYDGWTRGKKQEWVRMTFLGGGRQVGRSCLLLQTPESRVLLDCGIDVAANEDNSYPYLECPDFKIDELDAVIISHSHVDHSGLIPLLYKYGYKGPVYCTEPTRDVMALLQLDMVKIMRAEGRDPIFTSEEIKEMVKHTICLEFDEVTDITPDVRITLYNAGHILGSAMVHMHVGNGLHNILYTGDFKFQRSRLLEPAVTKFPRLETLMVESTYGGKENTLPTREECEKEVGEIIKQTVKRGGKVLFPVLGSGRAQEVLLIIESLVKNGDIPKIPVYIDGMVWDITAIHTAYPEFLNTNVRKLIFHKDANPFLADFFTRVGSQKERKQIIEEEGPCVIIATSGMLTGGPSVQYLKELCGNKNNSMVFTSYLGSGSLGQRIGTFGEREISFETGPNKTETFKIKMDVHRIDGFTGHAGRNELIEFVGKCNPKPRKVVINHGESRRCLDLASSLHKTYRVETASPRNLESVRLR